MEKFKLILPFDKNFCLNLCERPDRRKFMEDQFNSLGILDQITWHDAVKHPYTDFIAEKLRQFGKGAVKNGGEFNCTREHYTMIKSSYLKGYNSILVLEDDISLLNDKKLFDEILSSIPPTDSWDILRIASIWSCSGIIELHNSLNTWNKINSRFWGTGGYALSRAGMEYIINYYDKYIDVADSPFYWAGSGNDIKMLTPKVPLGIIKRSSISASDIQMVGSDTDILRDPEYSQLPLDYSKYGIL